MTCLRILGPPSIRLKRSTGTAGFSRWFRGPSGVLFAMWFSAKKPLDKILSRIFDLPILEVVSSDQFHQLAYASQRGAGRFELLFATLWMVKSSGFGTRKRRGFRLSMSMSAPYLPIAKSPDFPQNSHVPSLLRRAFLLEFFAMIARSLLPSVFG